MSETRSSQTHDRRTFLLGAGAVLLTACTDSDDESTASSATAPVENEAGDTPETSASAETDDAAAESSELAPLTPAMFESLAICAVAPSTTTGPFPNLESLDRRDITEGYPGHPLRLGFRVVDAGCQPISGAQVEIWHADATGDYSSYEDNGSGKDEGEGSTFLRGIQTADGDGIGEFLTIYPGWYEGRAVHIHATILIDGQEVHTTQLYFDEAYTDAVHTTGEYAQFGPPDTSWAADGLIGDPTSDGSGITLTAAPTALGEGTLGLINLGVSL